MSVKFQDYPEMVDQLARGGFDAVQTTALVVFVGRLYSGQNDLLEEVRSEMREEFAAVRSEFSGHFEKSRQDSDQGIQGLEARLTRKIDEASERTDGKIERIWRMMIGVFASMVVAMVGTLLVFTLRLLGAL